MNIFEKRPRLRWLVPVAVAAVAVSAPVIGTTLLADASPALPHKSAEQLLSAMARADVDGLSGTVVSHANLGLPAMNFGEDSSEFAALTSGTHTLRVWQAEDDKLRVAALSDLGESDFITNGTDAWTWSSNDNIATHYKVPDKRDEPAQPNPTDMPKTPQEAADQLMAKLGPTTDVSTDGTARVADREAYELVLKPKDKTSLIDEVRLAVDAEKYAPLRVQVFGKKSNEPALELGFTSISYAVPAAENFTFTPPPNAKVHDRTGDPELHHEDDADASAYQVVGKTWQSVLVLDDADSAQLKDMKSPIAQQIIESLPRASGSWGSGRIIESKLFTVLLLDDGRVLAGAVTPERIYEVAEELAEQK